MSFRNHNEPSLEKGPVTVMNERTRVTAPVVLFSKDSIGRAKILIDDQDNVISECTNRHSTLPTSSSKTPSASSDVYRTSDLSPPSYLTDDVALNEWRRIAPLLAEQEVFTPLMRTLLAGYCNALYRSVYAEKVIEKEGRYYSTKNSRGSILKRRHPAAKDSEDGWAIVMQLARQIDTHISRAKKASERESNSIMFK